MSSNYTFQEQLVLYGLDNNDGTFRLTGRCPSLRHTYVLAPPSSAVFKRCWKCLDTAGGTLLYEQETKKTTTVASVSCYSSKCYHCIFQCLDMICVDWMCKMRFTLHQLHTCDSLSKVEVMNEFFLCQPVFLVSLRRATDIPGDELSTPTW